MGCLFVLGRALLGSRQKDKCEKYSLIMDDVYALSKVEGEKITPLFYETEHLMSVCCVPYQV